MILSGWKPSLLKGWELMVGGGWSGSVPLIRNSVTLSHLVFDYLMDFNGWHLTFGNRCSSALFLCVESISHCPLFDRSAPWNSAFKEIVSLPACCSDPLVLHRWLPWPWLCPLLSCHGTWDRASCTQELEGVTEAGYLESFHVSALSLNYLLFIQAHMNSLNF